MVITRWLLLAVLMASTPGVWGQDSRMSERSKDALKGAIDVSVSSDKHSYKQGEQIWLTATIKNVGATPFYVFPRTSFQDDGDGVFIVRVTETPKCKLVFTGGAGTPAPPAKEGRTGGSSGSLVYTGSGRADTSSSWYAGERQKGADMLTARVREGKERFNCSGTVRFSVNGWPEICTKAPACPDRCRHCTPDPERGCS